MALDNTLRVRLVPFNALQDEARLRAWMSSPHVAPWWGDADQATAIAEGHSPNRHALVEVEGHPVGYVCWQTLTPVERAAAGLGSLPAGHMDVDLLIGEPDFIGRGIGPRVLSLVLERLRAEGISSVGVATDLENHRARRAFEKAGFRLFHVFEEERRSMCYLTRGPAELSDRADG